MHSVFSPRSPRPPRFKTEEQHRCRRRGSWHSPSAMLQSLSRRPFLRLAPKKESPMRQLFLLLAATLLVHTAGAADWTQFRGPHGSGVSGETGLPASWSATENIVWRTKLPGPGTSSPIVVGKRV